VDALAGLARQRHTLEEEPLMALQRQVSQPYLAIRAQLGEHLGHVRLDVPMAESVGHRYPVVPVLHEVELADSVDVDRRHRLALALREVDALPALTHAWRGWAEVAVEFARAVDGPDDRVERDHLQAKGSLAHPAQRLHDLLEREDVVHVVGSAKAGGQA
jgi:hypothetical protein